MLKLAGGFMILSGCLGLGFWYRQQFVLRLKNIRILQGILEGMMSEVGYVRTPLPDCCKRIGERQKEPFRGSFLEIYERMGKNEGERFSQVFCTVMGECLAALPVTEEDREHFLSFAREESYEDGQMQIRAIERSRELLGLTERRLEEENTEKCRMAVGLGAMSGMLLVIILL